VLDAIAAFTRMYRLHAAREDTELFPAFQKFFTRSEFDRLGDGFESQSRGGSGALDSRGR